MWLLNLWLVLLFSTLGAISAFIITYGEYLRHFPDKIRPLKLAARTALAAFLFFAVVSSLMMFGLSLILKQP